MPGCGKCHTCKNDLTLTSLGEWCNACDTLRYYASHGWTEGKFINYSPCLGQLFNKELFQRIRENQEKKI